MECECGAGLSVSRVCTRCDAPLCDECAQSVNGKSFCATCAAFLADRQASRPQPAAAPTPTPGAESAEGGLDDVYAGPLAEPATKEPAAEEPPAEPLPPEALPPEAPPTPPPPPGGPSDDIYDPEQAPAAEPSGWTTSVGGVEISGEGGGGSTAKAAIFSVIGGAVGIIVWYFVGIGFEKNYSLVSIGVGALAGIGALIGSGGGSPRAGAVAVVVGLTAMVLGDYLVMDELFRRDAQLFAAENAEYLAELERAAEDGFDGRDVRRAYEIPLSEWREMASEDRVYLRDELQGQLAELRAGQQGQSTLTFQEFLNLELFRAKTLVVFGIGLLAAWRTGLGAD